MKLFYTAFITAALLAGMQTFHANAAETSAGSPYGKTLCEGRTWDYYLEEYTIDNPDLSREVSGFHFSGTEMAGEQMYAVFRDAGNNPLALMREEDRKIFLYVPREEDSTATWAGLEVVNDDFTPVTGEVLLYDFSLDIGDKFISVGFDDIDHRRGLMIECEVTANSTFEFDGEKLDVQEFSLVYNPSDIHFKVIEGAGNISGLLPFPQIANYTSGFYKTIYHLLRVTDADGSVFYENKELLAGIDGVAATMAIDSALYDMLGRRVAEPVAGGLYVKDGRKVIWK